MIVKIKGFLSENKARLTGLGLAVAGGLLGVYKSASAAVDADVASTTASMVSTLKENITGVITANISDIVIVGVIIFSIGFVWRLARRFMR